MAETKRVRFLVSRGMGGIYFPAGAEAELSEPWLSHFLRNGHVELVGTEPVVKPATTALRPTGKRKKK